MRKHIEVVWSIPTSKVSGFYNEVWDIFIKTNIYNQEEDYVITPSDDNCEYDVCVLLNEPVA